MSRRTGGSTSRDDREGSGCRVGSSCRTAPGAGGCQFAVIVRVVALELRLIVLSATRRSGTVPSPSGPPRPQTGWWSSSHAGVPEAARGKDGLGLESSSRQGPEGRHRHDQQSWPLQEPPPTRPLLRHAKRLIVPTVGQAPTPCPTPSEFGKAQPGRRRRRAHRAERADLRVPAPLAGGLRLRRRGLLLATRFGGGGLLLAALADVRDRVVELLRAGADDKAGDGHHHEPGAGTGGVAGPGREVDAD
jgi:hypothetical protein